MCAQTRKPTTVRPETGDIIPRGKVMRIVSEEGKLPHTEYRTRDLGALLVEAEWGWSTDPDEAYIFATMTAAEMHADLIKDKSAGRPYPATVSTEARERREERDRAGEETLMATVSSTLSCPPPAPLPEVSEERKPERKISRATAPLKDRVAIARRGARTRRGHREVSPEEAFHDLEERHLA